jgi:hypothetical protein
MDPSNYNNYCHYFHNSHQRTHYAVEGSSLVSTTCNYDLVLTTATSNAVLTAPASNSEGGLHISANHNSQFICSSLRRLLLLHMSRWWANLSVMAIRGLRRSGGLGRGRHKHMRDVVNMQKPERVKQKGV